MKGTTEIYEFGPFRLEVKERRLLRDGQPVQLRAKVFDTLRVLVENHGRLVCKDDLMKAVWPDAVVEEGRQGRRQRLETFRRPSDRRRSPYSTKRSPFR